MKESGTRVQRLKTGSTQMFMKESGTRVQRRKTGSTRTFMKESGTRVQRSKTRSTRTFMSDALYGVNDVRFGMISQLPCQSVQLPHKNYVDVRNLAREMMV